jgi:hypothetical protein
MSRAPSSLLIAGIFTASLLAGCMVRTHSQPPPGHASGGWRTAPAGPPPRHVPPGQIRRQEVHERNAARKEAHGRGHDKHHR